MVRSTDVTATRDQGKELKPLNPKAVLLVEKSEWEDALRVQEGPQKKRRWIGGCIILAGVVSAILGFQADERWFWWTWALLSVPVFGAGWYLMADMELRRLRKEIARLDGEIQELDEKGRSVV